MRTGCNIQKVIVGLEQIKREHIPLRSLMHLCFNIGSSRWITMKNNYFACDALNMKNTLEQFVETDLFFGKVKQKHLNTFD